MTGTDAATYARERPGVSAFALEDRVVDRTYAAYSRGVDGLWGMYQWLDRAPKGRNEQGVWWRRHDEYNKGWAKSSWRDALAGSTASGEDVVRCGAAGVITRRIAAMATTDVYPGKDLGTLELTITDEMVHHYIKRLDEPNPWYTTASPFGGSVAPVIVYQDRKSVV